MGKVPRLVDLCMENIRDELLIGDDDNKLSSVIYELPSELFDGLLPLLPPLALQKLHENRPLDFRNYFEPADEYHGGCRKRKRCGILDRAWWALLKLRWPIHDHPTQAVSWLDKHGEEKTVSTNDWQQIYWEKHLQDCVDAVAETALLPSYDGSIGEIQIPDFILQYIVCRDHLIKSGSCHQKFSGHCQQFGVYARSLRLPNVLCVAETCHLLQTSKLERLELQWIKSADHVEGLCELLKQNSGTLKSVDFMHCKLSSNFVDKFWESLYIKGLQTHGIEHFSIKRSSFLQTDSSPMPAELTRFLTSGRSLHSLTLCDDHLGRNFARVVFSTLLDSSASISILDLSENNISGFLSQFRWKSTSRSLGLGKSLQSLRVLNLRNNNLEKDDADSLRQALVHMPNLQNLDLSDNPIEDGIRSLVSYFMEISCRDLPFIDLKLENCELTCNHATQLLGVLSTMKTPLKMLSIKGNHLGSKIGALLGKFMCTGVRGLDVEDTGLGSSGFMLALKEICEGLKLVYMNISNNQGGIESAKFIARIISLARELIAIDARYNSMPVESIAVISPGLKAAKGKLEHLDMSGNSFGDGLADYMPLLAEFHARGNLSLNLSGSAARNVPYDDEP
ncbi:uncharacterized protein [Primulina eburnea]|uniref:uncharacterized protein n=1 Tax=Primulina eburnea TaxID=1245227 RepID=UPI003C6C52AF